MSGDLLPSDSAYSSSWNGSVEPATRNALLREALRAAPGEASEATRPASAEGDARAVHASLGAAVRRGAVEDSLVGL